MLGGLARIDYVEGTVAMLLTVFSKLPVNITSIENAVQFCCQINEGRQTVLRPPLPGPRPFPFPRIVQAIPELHVTGQKARESTMDIVFSGVAWTSIVGKFPKATLSIWTPGGSGVYVREEPLLKGQFKGRIGKFFGLQMHKGVMPSISGQNTGN